MCITTLWSYILRIKFIDVLRAYSDVLRLNGENTEYYILSSLIFHNNNITIGSKPIYIKWDQEAVKNIKDLVHDNGEFFLQDEFEHTFNIKTNFVECLGLKRAIMAYARTHSIAIFSKKLHMPLLPANIHLLIKSKKGGKELYTIQNPNLDKPTSQHKME